MSFNAINTIKIINEYRTAIGSTLYIRLDIKYSNYVQDDSIYIFDGFLRHYKDRLDEKIQKKGKQWNEQLYEDKSAIKMSRQGNELSFDEDIGDELDKKIFEIFLEKLVNETKLDENDIKEYMKKYNNDYIIINDVTESMRKSTKTVPQETINSLDNLLNIHEKDLNNETYRKGKDWVKQLNEDNSVFTVSRHEDKLYFDEDVGKDLGNELKNFFIENIFKLKYQS